MHPVNRTYLLLTKGFEPLLYKHNLLFEVPLSYNCWQLLIL